MVVTAPVQHGCQAPAQQYPSQAYSQPHYPAAGPQHPGGYPQQPGQIPPVQYQPQSKYSCLVVYKCKNY